MSKSKIPIIFGVTGLVIGFVFMAGYFYELHYNPFHFPTMEQAVEQAQTSGHGYSAPPLYHFLERLMFALVPGLLLPAIGIDGWVAIVLWVVAVLLNAPIYYCVGLVCAWALKRMRLGNTTS